MNGTRTLILSTPTICSEPPFKTYLRPARGATVSSCRFFTIPLLSEINIIEHRYFDFGALFLVMSLGKANFAHY